MTVSSEAKRTLVKSPPELWSEVSDADLLARHLDGLEQVRITRVEPETAVEWEAEGASGSVRLQPSGFGTKVTLSLSRELPSAEPLAAEPVTAEPEPASEPIAEPDPEPVPVAEMEPEPELVGSAPEPGTSMPGSVAETPRQGFFARLFKRRRKPVASVDDSICASSEPEPVALVEPEPEPEPVLNEAEQVVASESELAPEPVQPAMSITADLATLEAEMAEQDEAMLTAMLDRLGAAHHRPFSRS